jgi:hypothetical protein
MFCVGVLFEVSHYLFLRQINNHVNDSIAIANSNHQKVAAPVDKELIELLGADGQESSKYLKRI